MQQPRTFRTPRRRSRRHLLGAGLLTAVAAIFHCGPVSEASRPTLPPVHNVVMVVADDLSVRLAAYGDPVVKTPNIDRLAQRGLLFERAYCQYPICSPSRTSFLSGKLPTEVGILNNKDYPRRFKRDLTFLPEALSRSGITTLRIGKILHGETFETAVDWDIVPHDGRAVGEVRTAKDVLWLIPRARRTGMSEEREATIRQAAADLQERRKATWEAERAERRRARAAERKLRRAEERRLKRAGKGKATEASPGEASASEASPGEETATAQDPLSPPPKPGPKKKGKKPKIGSVFDRVVVADADEGTLGDSIKVDHANYWLEEMQERGDRFFMALGFARPHIPFEVPQRFFDLYADVKIQVPRTAWVSDRPRPNGGGTDRDQVLLRRSQLREIARSYYAATSYVDAQIGRLLDKLDELGLSENTTVLLVSDHGFLLGEHGYLQKTSLFEEAIQVPLIVAGPGIVQGQRTRSIVELLDLFPTIVDLFGVEVETRTQGRSLTPLLADPATPWHGRAFTVMRDGFGKQGLARSLRTDRFRYTDWQNGSPPELYDHETDPNETANLASKPAYWLTRVRLAWELERAASR